MKRAYLLALFGLCFLFISPNQAFPSTFAKGKEIKVKIVNCKVDQTTVMANKIEFKVKKRTHKYNLIGGNFTMKSFPFSFDQVTYEEFLGTDINKIFNVIITNITNGVMKGNSEDIMGTKYEWEAKLNHPIYKTFDIELEIEEF
ncbi:MAG TPA: hypothetical protein DD434_14485 [Bacteroidales bacterium]|nr:hypothetical protein [Bacteroidales bacterium]